MRHLIELSFGPVQDFIAAARRTADLWAGSRLLSQVARAAGVSLLQSGAELIYPAPQRVNCKEELSNLSNVMLAVVEGDADAAREALAKAQTAAREVLMKEASHVLAELKDLEPFRGRFEAQIGDVLETFGAWAAWEEGADYAQAYAWLKQAFGARKNTRDFAPHASGAPVPKNSLDGLRETVIPERPTVRLRRRLQLGEGERLDGLGVIKRAVGRRGNTGFVPLSRVAAHAWLNALGQEDCERLKQCYEPLVEWDCATRVHGGAFKRFPYDAALVYEERLALAIAQARGEGEQGREALRALEALREVLVRLWRRYGRPNPYAALLMADGDQMGKCVGSARDRGDHIAITQAVARFADRAIEVLQTWEGQAIYAGGDDVMGLLPLASVVRAPLALERVFAQEMGKLPPHVARPTLRVGVAIAHMLEPMGATRELAHRAEKLAKGAGGSAAQGHALGLLCQIRAGHELALRLPFSAEADFDALAQWMQAYGNGVFPARLGYDARGLDLDRAARRLPPGVAQAGFVRLLERARSRGGGEKLTDAHRGALMERLAVLRGRFPGGGEFQALGTELIFARWLSARRSSEMV